MKIAQKFHLTYCSNIHSGESWAEVSQNLHNYMPAIRQRLNWEGPFGIGLRLSARAAAELENPQTLSAFQGFLAEQNFYVFTINGFPYGVFHKARVKEEVYLPDWMDEERLRYTNLLARILASLLPNDPRLQGSVSTVPGAFKQRIQSPEHVLRMAQNMLRHVAFLRELHQQTGKTISLALEAEPCCYMETVDEVLAFFRDYLFNPEVLERLAGELSVPLKISDVRRHLGVCYDACHMAVEFEDPASAINRIKEAGISIYKFQISSALRVRFRAGDGRAAEVLAPFVEGIYLHQVVEKNRNALRRFTDLPEGLSEEAAAGGGDEKEWRIHFHVPIFLDEMKNFSTTQDHLVSLLDLIKHNPVCPYLEVETYTWDVLPQEYRTLDVASAVARELAWVRNRIES